VRQDRAASFVNLRDVYVRVCITRGAVCASVQWFSSRGSLFQAAKFNFFGCFFSNRK